MVASSLPSSLNLIFKVWGHLSRRRHIQFYFLLVVMLASGIAELVSLSSVLPFLAVLSSPENLFKQPLVQEFAPHIGITHPLQLVLPSALIFAFTSVLAAGIRLLNLWLNGRLAAAMGSDVSSEAYLRTLYQPYLVHVRRNSSTLISTMTRHIGITVLALNALLQIFSAFVVAVGLLIGLLIVDWQVALSTAGLLGIAYVIVAITSRRQLLKNGAKIAKANDQRVQALQEGLGAIRDVLLDGNQASYLELYRRSDRPQRQLESKNRFLSLFPRYVLEAVGLVAIAVLGGLLVLQKGSGVSVIPLLGALALGAQRLLPALQQIYSGWAGLKSWRASLAAVVDMLEQPLPKQLAAVDPKFLQKSIRFKAVYFRYASDQPEVLKGLDLEIKSGEHIGLIGSTGSGKSSLADMLMGLLPPSTGRVLIDGLDLYDPEHSQLLLGWRASVAHVPQNIYLADSSIAENIAFGIPKSKIDFARLRRAAQQAQIESFIESRSEGYDSFVGERGIRLSGGQRQRIGIARALYKHSSVIILDEATSALDTVTENAVMSSVEGLSRDLTLIIIAHRLSTVQRCDRVIRLAQGKVLDDGPPPKVLSNIS